MPFVKGRKKTGGRMKGIPGTVSASYSAAEACRAQGIDPFAILAAMAARGQCSNDNIRPAAETLCRYLQPQFRQVEIEVRKTPEQIVADLMDRPELRRRVAEYLEVAERGTLP